MRGAKDDLWPLRPHNKSPVPLKGSCGKKDTKLNWWAQPAVALTDYWTGERKKKKEWCLLLSSSVGCRAMLTTGAMSKLYFSCLSSCGVSWSTFMYNKMLKQFENQTVCGHCKEPFAQARSVRPQHATRSKWWHFEVPFAVTQMTTHGTRQQGIRIYPPVIFREEDKSAVSPWETSQI